MVASEVMEIINFLPADVLCFILGIAFLLVPVKLAECTRRKRTFSTGKWVSKPRGGKSFDLSDSSDTSCTRRPKASVVGESTSKKVPVKVGMSLPPGLQFSGPSHPEDIGMSSSTSFHGKCPNAEAPVFISSQEDDENTIRGTAFSVLQETLSKLTPEEAAKVHEFLKAKQASEAQRSGWNSMSQSNRAVRPFTPFQGHRKTSAKVHDAPATKSLAKDAKDSWETLRSSLYELSLMDSTKVLMVRKISKLGLDAARLLEVYFSRFGPVERCLASATRLTTKWGEVRSRPATVAFLVMTSEAVKTILDFEGEHCVEGVTLSVCPFQSHPIDSI